MMNDTVTVKQQPEAKLNGKPNTNLRRLENHGFSVHVLKRYAGRRTAEKWKGESEVRLEGGV